MRVRSGGRRSAARGARSALCAAGEQGEQHVRGVDLQRAVHLHHGHLHRALLVALLDLVGVGVGVGVGLGLGLGLGFVDLLLRASLPPRGLARVSMGEKLLERSLRARAGAAHCEAWPPTEGGGAASHLQ